MGLAPNDDGTGWQVREIRTLESADLGEFTVSSKLIRSLVGSSSRKSVGSVHRVDGGLDTVVAVSNGVC